MVRVAVMTDMVFLKIWLAVSHQVFFLFAFFFSFYIGLLIVSDFIAIYHRHNDRQLCPHDAHILILGTGEYALLDDKRDLEYMLKIIVI